MKQTALLALMSSLLLAACNPVTPPAAPAGQLAYGLTTGGQLVSFGLDNANASLSTMNVTGLGSGETLVDLDVRNTDNMLYALSSAGNIYRLSMAGAATRDGAALGEAAVAMDFNPVANRLRVVGTADRNFRVTLNSAPVPGTSPAGTVTNDGTYAYALSTPNPNLVAAAYTNSFNNSASGAVNPNTTTELFTIDADTDALVLHSNNPTGPAGNFSLLTSRGALGVDAMPGMTGFDITGTSSAYLSTSTGGTTSFYTVNLGTGAATLKTTLSGVSLKSFALALTPQ
ncbi:DUF4394 domain-containing protein [Deinococcus arcticus]|uniref:DUF4394 domain-containing protein n=1 Tax=Deinococcus arcticus TaxID=2136176 RepID=A0A2T3W938_9DEIO|nr:DUF4394 domain-containing protein [Deinococcus arcticus]PTA68402.1 hypothetical protein C8263_08205 [Deinococcus arcticus]